MAVPRAGRNGHEMSSRSISSRRDYFFSVSAGFASSGFFSGSAGFLSSAFSAGLASPGGGVSVVGEGAGAGEGAAGGVTAGGLSAGVSSVLQPPSRASDKARPENIVHVLKENFTESLLGWHTGGGL